MILTASFLLVMHLFVVLYEEPALTGRFGETSLAYRRSVRRWLIRRPTGMPRRGVV